jgi:hypothetical protein
MNKLFLSAILCVFSILSIAQVPVYVPINGLVGWWPFSGNTNDLSGNGNNGTNSGANLSIDRFNNVNSAYSFYGNNDFISIPTTNNQFNSQEYCISYWFKTNQIASNINGGSNVNPAIISRVNIGGPSAGNGIAPLDNFCIYEIGGSNHLNTPSYGAVSGNNTVLGNVWKHIVFNIRVDSIICYLNGVKVNSNLRNGQITFQPYPIRFGRSQYTYWKDFSGELDDIGYWNRPLTSCEIESLYSGTISNFSVSAGMDQTICAGYPVTLSATGAITYAWSNNVTNGVAFNPSTTATYAVSGTDANGCVASDEVLVTVNDATESILTESALDMYTLNGQTYTQSGTYTQVITNVAGCDSTITLNLTLSFTELSELSQGICAFPNPTSDVIFIKCPMSSEAKFTIVDAAGRFALDGYLKSELNAVNLNALAPGSYTMTLDNQTLPIRIIKQ